MADSNPMNRGTQRKDSRPLWADQYPELDRGPIPVAYLHEQKYFELERDRIFRRCWLYAGRVEEIPMPNGFLVKEIEICKASVLIVRDDATGTLSAFHNLCKHRLNKLVYESSGSVGSFVCNYHAWAYDRTGKLRHVPDEEAFYGLNKSKCNLSTVAIDEWRGFMFINLDPKPQQSLLEYLEDIPAMLKEFPFEKLVGANYGFTRELAVNWKTGQQTNMESYHAEKLHLSPMNQGVEQLVNPGNRPINMKLMKRHRFFAFGMKREGGFENMPPTLKLAVQVATLPEADERDAAPRPEATGRHVRYPGTNFNDAEWWAGDNFFIFPNLLIGTNAGFFQTLVYEPLEVRRSRFRNNFYYAKIKTAGDLFALKVSIAFQLNVISGDMWAGDRVQDGLATGVASEMMLNDSELGIRHEFKVYNEMINA